uniref:Uncharacterized protein n=1 Tax=viral metagenome TaxID=1070528 RepID=A0A6C0DDP6_9ZZZZ
MSAQSTTRSKKTSIQSTSTPRLIHKLLWVSALIHSLGLNSIPEKNGQLSKPPLYFNRGRTWGSKAKSSAHEQRASILKQAVDPEKLGSFMITSTDYRKTRKPLTVRHSYGLLTNENRNYYTAGLPHYQFTNHPSLNELHVLKEQLENELEKREQRNQRYSVSRSAYRSHRSNRYSTQKVKHGSMSHQHKTSHR